MNRQFILLSNITFRKPAIKPGEALALSNLSNCVFFGLPGNPVSAMVTLYQLAVQIMQIMGCFAVKPAMRFNTVPNKIKKGGLHGFQYAAYSVGENRQPVVLLTSSQGSAGVYS